MTKFTRYCVVLFATMHVIPALPLVDANEIKTWKYCPRGWKSALNVGYPPSETLREYCGSSVYRSSGSKVWVQMLNSTVGLMAGNSLVIDVMNEEGVIIRGFGNRAAACAGVKMGEWSMGISAAAANSNSEICSS